MEIGLKKWRCITLWAGTRKMHFCGNQPVSAIDSPENQHFRKILLRRSICGTLLALLFHTRSMNRN